MSTITVTHSHAAPVPREYLCRSGYKARTAGTQRDRNAAFAEAWAFTRSIEVLAISQDQAPAPGIKDRDNLPQNAEVWAREFIGRDANRILGPQEA